jgi:hypothetical protein
VKTISDRRRASKKQVQALPGIKDTFAIIGFKAFSLDTTAGWPQQSPW